MNPAVGLAGDLETPRGRRRQTVCARDAHHAAMHVSSHPPPDLDPRGMPHSATATGSTRKWQLLAFAGVALVLVWRNYNALRYPILFSEDGWLLFTHFLDHRDLGSVLRQHNGYVSIVPQLCGWSIAFLPMTWQPRAFALTAVLIAAFAFSLFTSRRFEWLVADVRLRAALCVLFVILPNGNFAIDTCTMFCNWNVLLIACLSALARAPRGRRELLVDTVLLTLAITTNPVTAILLPVWAWRCWRPDYVASDDVPATALRLHYSVLIGTTIAYVGLMVQPTSTGNVGPWQLLPRWSAMVFDRVVLESIAGHAGKIELHSAGLDVAAGIAILAGFAAILWTARRRIRRTEWIALTVMAGLIAAATASAVIGRPHNFDNMTGSWDQRYTFVQRTMFTAMLLCPLLALLRGAGIRTRALAMTAVGLHAVSLAADNRDMYSTFPSEGRQIAEFVASAEAWRAAPDGEQLTLRRYYRDLVVPAPPR